VYPDAANAAEGRVSVLAPIGSALIGLRVGDEIDWELPNRRHTRLRVIALEHQER
jgi:regulator of nucleoside diphosphate kinase